MLYKEEKNGLLCSSLFSGEKVLTKNVNLSTVEPLLAIIF